MTPVVLQQPKRVFFGVGCAGRAAAELADAGRSRLYVVSSPTAARMNAPLVDSWRARGLAVMIDDTVKREPDIGLFEAVLSRARAFQPDGIVGLGGGSPLDVAKLVAALLDGRQGVRETFGIGNLRGRAVYLACIPTTAGTGSEVSPNAVLIDETDRAKKGAISPHLVPDIAFLDPALTVPVPSAVTAAVGIDALVHCAEAYANRAAHPVVDVYALEGIRRIAANIERAVHQGDDLGARTEVMLGAYYGGLCLGPVNTAGVHALSAPLGGYGIAHGVANALLLPHVFRFNLPAMPERYAHIAQALGVEPRASATETAEAGLARLVELSRRCGIPERLGRVGVKEGDLHSLAREAIKVQRLLKNNPREITEADALALYRAAF